MTTDGTSANLMYLRDIEQARRCWQFAEDQVSAIYQLKFDEYRRDYGTLERQLGELDRVARSAYRFFQTQPDLDLAERYRRRPAEHIGTMRFGTHVFINDPFPAFDAPGSPCWQRWLWRKWHPLSRTLYDHLIRINGMGS